MLLPAYAGDSELHETIVLLFRDAQMETVHCSLCGDYHPPELHLSPITPFDPLDPEEA